MTDIFSERDPARMAISFAALERFADRRERFLEHLDLTALDISNYRAIGLADDRLFETIMFAGLYAQDLGDMAALRASLSTPRQNAA